MKQGLILTRMDDDNNRFIKSVLDQYEGARTPSDFIRFKSILSDSVCAVPMLACVHEDFSQQELREKCASAELIVVSSRHGVPSLRGAAFSHARVAVVGAQTAQAFADLFARMPDFTAPTMGDLLSSDFMRVHSSHRILYIRGREVSYDVSSWAREQGKTYAELVVYNCAPVTTFPPFFDEFILRHDEIIVTFFSRRTAQSFINNASENNLLLRIKRIKALCISDGVLESLGKNLGREAYVAATPDLQGMAALVLEHFHAS